MSERLDRWRALLPWTWTVLVWIGSVALLVAGGTQAMARPENIIAIAAAFLIAALGLLIAVRRPGNRVAWVLLIVAASFVLTGAAELQIDGRPDPSTLWDVLAIIWSNTSYFFGFLIPLLLLLYIFPTGEFLSRRWALAGWAAGIAVAALVFVEGFATEVGPGDEAWTIPNPLGLHDLGSMFDQDGEPAGVLGLVFVTLVVTFLLGAPFAMVFRYRRSSTIARTQIKLVLVAMASVPLVFVSGVAFPEARWISTVVAVVAIVVVPLSIGVAILRHNLFDIDIIISRSLTFGVLAVFIGAVYVGIVVGIGEVVGRSGGSGFGLSVVATAVVAIGFQPVRSRAERWANRLVYGKRTTPYEVLARFSHGAVEDSDGDVLSRIPRLIVDGTGAESAALWVGSNGGFCTASVWPEDGPERRLDEGDVFRVPDADLSLPMSHDGELLGGISLVAARGVAITPPERELLTNLADGLGLTVRNRQLTAALSRQVKDLQRSRNRVASAADEARRSLEHDLDSGPQQELVAVKVKLGPIRKLAEQAGATSTAGVLADIDAQARDAIQAVRDFAAGIYPPLLGAEGLAVALGQEVEKAALPVDLEVDRVNRYPRDVESAVYFSILEALQNTAKYADATKAIVRLSERKGDLFFEVSDDGKGFDPAVDRRGAGLDGIGDRIDTVGGLLTITSTPGKGTIVTGTVPL